MKKRQQKKTKNEMIDLILECQGVPEDKKDKPKYYKKYQLEEKTKGEVKEIASKLVQRKGGTYRYQVSTWTKKKLINLILGCQGEPKNTKKMKGGWGYSFF